jgi:hypothetical protein
MPRLMNRALSPVVARVPLRPLLLRHRALLEAEPEAAVFLLRSIPGFLSARLSALIAPVDVRDPAWPTIARATWISRPLHVVVWSAMPVDEDRPLALT